MTDPTDDQESQTETSAEEAELSKDTVEDLEVTDAQEEDAKGGRGTFGYSI